MLTQLRGQGAPLQRRGQVSSQECGQSWGLNPGGLAPPSKPSPLCHTTSAAKAGEGADPPKSRRSRSHRATQPHCDSQLQSISLAAVSLDPDSDPERDERG